MVRKKPCEPHNKAIRQLQGKLSLGKELIVRFLPFDVSIRTIRSLFGEHGRLTNINIARDRTSGEKVGTAYVQILHDTDAERVMDALDGHTMSRGPIRVTWARASRPSRYVVRVLDLPSVADRKTLKKIFSRYGELRRVEVDYDTSGRSNRVAFMTFANREEGQDAVKELGGRFLRADEGIIRVRADWLNRELERSPAAKTASVSGAVDSASPRTAIPDLLTGSVVQVAANCAQVDASKDLIDLSDPSPPPPLSADVSPVEVGYIYAKKREYEIPVHFYAASESVKLEVATQILLAGGYAEQDVNNNEQDECNTKVTLVVRFTPELVTATHRLTASGVDCFICDDPAIRGGHSFHPSEFTTVNVTMAPVCRKIKYSQHVVFLSPIDDPEDMGAAMDIMMLQRTDVNLVSVLFDESDDDQRLQVTQMLNLLL